MRLIAPAIALIVCTPASASARQTFLISLQGLQLGEKEYIDSFSIDTWGIEVIATCQIPPGWTITAGSSADPTGLIAGEPSLGVTFLDKARLKYLNGIVLIRMNGHITKYTRRLGGITQPATFIGKADIGTYGPSERTRTQKLDFHNINLIAASRCPAPRR
jgi:hypothetical protein